MSTAVSVHRRPLAWAVASVALLAAVTITSPQGLHFFDPVMQSLALQQSEAGVSPSWNVLMRVDPHDIARDVPEFIAWWPPSTQMLALPLHRAGLTPAVSLRVITLLAIGAGAVGWTRWFANFALPRTWLIALAVALPWLRAVSVFLFRYSTDALAFAALPWLLLLHVRLLQQLRAGSQGRFAVAAFTGLTAGAAFGFKYSLGVIALAALAATWLWAMLFMREPARRRGALVLLLIATAAAALLPVVWRVVVWRNGSATPLGHPATSHGFDPMGFVYLIANPALALTDLFGPLFFVFVFPGLAPLATGTMTTVAWIGFPAGLLLVWLLARALRAGADDNPTWIGVVTLAGTACALFVLWFAADVSHEPRLIAPAALGALPIAIVEGRRLWPTTAGFARIALALAGLAAVVLPLAFGPYYVQAKVRSTVGVQPGATGFNLPNLHARDIAAARRELATFHHAKAVWVVSDPEIALELPGRVMLLTSGGSLGEDLQNIYVGRTTLGEWRTSEDRELLVLWSAGDETTPPVPLASVRNVTTWEHTPLKHCGLTLWRAWLRAAKP